MSNKTKITDIDLYELLGLTINASEQEIKKAYRKKALVCHPDKNPNNPKAGELFHQLSEALKILTDPSARSAYDRVLKAKEAAKLRHKELDSKRKKFKDDLEAREEAARLEKFHTKTDEEKLQAEIERLRKEGAKLLEEELNFVNQQINQEVSKNVNNIGVDDGSDYRIKIEWSLEEDKNNLYNEDSLRRMLLKYGDINALVVSSKKGSGIVEFETKEAANLAFMLEQGLSSNPLKLKWVDKNKGKSTNTSKQPEEIITERDYESLVMRNLRQAEERKRLIEQLQEEEGE